MTVENTVHSFECCMGINSNKDCDDCYYYSTKKENCVRMVVDDAMTILKRQLPRRPVCDSGAYYCPNCDSVLSKYEPKEEIRFCQKCGQRVSWDLPIEGDDT